MDIFQTSFDLTGHIPMPVISYRVSYISHTPITHWTMLCFQTSLCMEAHWCDEYHDTRAQTLFDEHRSPWWEPPARRRVSSITIVPSKAYSYHTSITKRSLPTSSSSKSVYQMAAVIKVPPPPPTTFGKQWNVFQKMMWTYGAHRKDIGIII